MISGNSRHPVLEAQNALIDHDHQPQGTSLIGLPTRYVAGQFSGKIMRAELYELQQAKLGRKYARVDRRPLDPPPIVVLTLYEVKDSGVEHEIKNLDDVQLLGMLCTVDLFPAPDLPSSPGPSDHHHHVSTHMEIESPKDSMYYLPNYNTTPHYQLESHASQSYLPYSMQHPSEPIYDGQSVPPPDEHSKLTHALVGATFVQANKIDWNGSKKLMFVFADLAVKVEGTFILRYRIFDLFSKADGHTELTVQAQCFGGAFKVYSTKEFPGLQASTELTKHISRYGVRLNIRETERKRRKKDELTRSEDALFLMGKRDEAEDDETIHA